MEELKKILSIKRFVDDAKSYNILKNLWKDVFKETIGIDVDSYVNNFYSNGKEILDGNPILSTLIKNNKAIRIIQLENDPEEPIFASWTDKIIINGIELEELVISLQLNPDTYVEAKNLILLFSANTLTPSILLGINEKYDVKWNLGKLSNAVHKADYNRIFHGFRSLYESSLQDKNFNLTYFKNFHSNYVRYPWHAITFIGDSPLHHSYSNFIRNIDLINDLVSINQSIDLDKLKNADEYIVLLVGQWNTHDYITKLHTYSEEAEKEFDFLKDTVPSNR